MQFVFAAREETRKQLLEGKRDAVDDSENNLTN